MDVYPFASIFSTVSPFFLIVSILGILMGILMMVMKDSLPVPTMGVGLIIAVTSSLLLVGSGAVEHKIRQVEITEYVTSLGLEVTQGTPNVFANNDSEITVSKYGQDYKCNVYSPSDVNEKIFLVCDSAIGYGRGDVEDLAKGAKELPAVGK